MYTPAKERYETMEYNRCGESGLMLPKVSLGLWHNFGDTSDYENMKQLCFTAFERQAMICGRALMETGAAASIFWRALTRA